MPLPETSSPPRARPRQRGLYSELLAIPHTGGYDEFIQEDFSVTVEEAREQAVPSVRTYTRPKNLELAATDIAKANFDDPTVEPKVVAPFITRPGCVPRKIEIERKKRLFAAQSLEGLLRDLGVDYTKLPSSSLSGLSKTVGMLPLEVFDSEDLEERSPQEWLKLRRVDKDGKAQGVPARGLLLDKNGQGNWREGSVLRYLEKEKLWEFQTLESTAVPVPLHRMHVCFKAEDPFNFARRVAGAHTRRHEAEMALLYNLYVDSMPIDTLPEVDSQQAKRILQIALSTRSLQALMAAEHHSLAPPLIAEIRTQAARAQNKITFDAWLHANPKHSMVQDLILPPPPPQKPMRRRGVIDLPYNPVALTLPVARGTLEVPASGYDDKAHGFSFSSFWTKPELIKICVALRSECLKALGLSFFSIISKSVRLEEFTNLQSVATTATSLNLKDTWPGAVVHHIRTSLKEMRKGWFNLEEANNEVYAFSKLRKFLTFVNFVMQDTLRFLVEDSLHAYTAFLLRACEYTAKVHATNHVELLTPSGAPAPPISSRLPLFVVDLQVDGQGPDVRFGYSTPPEAFLDAPLACYDKALTQIQSIVRVERKVMRRLFWSFDPVMNSVHPSEAWVQKLRGQMEEALRRSITALHDYAKMFERFLPFLRLEIIEYMKEVEEKYASGEVLQVDQLKALVLQHQKAISEIESTIPENANLGVFNVTCVKVSRALVAKHQRLAELLLELMARKTIESTNSLVDKYKAIQRRLNKLPASIEELTELREYMGGIYTQLGELKPLLTQTLANFGVLDSVEYKLDRGAFLLKWEVFAWPKDILQKVVEVEDELGRRKREYQLNMEEEQEGFVERLKSLRSEVESLHQFTDLSRLDQVAAHIRRIKRDLQECDEEARRFNSREALFGKDLTEYSSLTDVQKAFEPYCDLWENTDNWVKWRQKWMHDPFMGLDAEKIDRDVNNAFKNLNKALRFFEKAGLDGCLQIAKTIRAQVDEFRPNIPLITGLRNPGMKERHWKELSKRVEKDIVPSESLTLAKLLTQGLAKFGDVVTRISETAGKEYTIETALDKMDNAWRDVYLNIEAYRETGTCILKGVDEYVALLDEHITMTQAMSFSSFKGPFEERIEHWNRSLQTVSEVIDEWVGVQRNWLYLQPIFDSPDINKQLPMEGKRFTTVDKHWRQTMGAAQGGKTLAIKFCSDTRLLERFRESNKLLEMVQKGLADYLETKRAGFSRFYFLSNDELLEILSQTKDPLAVQPHLKKCFEGIRSVDFNENDLTIHAMNSAEGEKIAFVTPIDPNNKNIEVWMVELNRMMCRSVRQQMIMAVEDYAKTPRTEWMQRWPGQVVINGSQVHWTLDTEGLIRDKGNAGVREYYETLIKQLNDMVFLIRGKLSSMARITIGALAVIDVHARDVMKNMAEAGVEKVTDFDWISQMRFYWEGDNATGDLKVVMVSSKRDYGYEYLGNSFRLVITPLTDKCYLTIMGALQMVLGGAPAGPAGTGKTETTKDLAKALAKQCVVFNCSDGLDYLAMGKFFKGLASSGAWACFDEFNRINIEVLSVIAQQIMTLQGAVMRKETRVIFEDTDIYVDPEFAVFITMNPGYAGRSDLPDNLEALFRPVAMMVPDYVLIGEIMLFSFGYLENRKCAQKMVATFRLCSEQLSSQDHYDYGMRAVKTVITAAGNLKRVNPDENEEALLLRALQDVNVPKFLAHDLPLFDGILSDLFPGISRPPFDYGPFLAAVKLMCERANLQAVPIFLRKIIELYEMICVRHGLMVVGPTGGGKSCNIAVLREALGYLKAQNVKGVRYEKVRTYHLNPKSITMGQLYGQFDENTHEWQDGILAGLVRDCIRQQNPDLKWIIFDGPVDAIWIENMNTVLDDNKKLCLTSGEIMSLSEEMTMMFEPEDLAVASPATVSRCGMIYMEPTSLGWDVLLQSWMATLPKTFSGRHQAALLTLFDSYVAGTLTVMRRYTAEPLPTVDNCLVQGLINILDAYLDVFRPKEGRESKTKQEVEDLIILLEPLFLFSLVWSLACTVNTQGRKLMDGFIRGEMASQGSVWTFPNEGKVYDYAFDLPNRAWVPWMKTVEPYRHDSKLSFSELIIPTMDSVRYTYLLSHLVKAEQHVLMTGPTGTGKTVNINEMLQKGLDDKYVPVCLAFSAQTSANMTQDLIDGKCEKRRKGVFGPAAGKKFVIFVDDVNMPQREFYGAQPPIEILRQWFDSGGWYDRKALSFRQIIDVIFVCACGPPGGGRNPVTARFFRHFNVIGYTPMQDESMELIFGTILGNFLSPFDESVQALAPGICKATIEIYNTILDDLRPTPTKPHYTFNLRDLSKVFQGLLMIPLRRDTSVVDLVRVWVHENRRVFADRLINEQDREWFDTLVYGKLPTHLGIEDESRLGDRRIICGDFMVPGADPKIYEEIRHLSELQPTIEDYLGEYNAESKQPMNLVMFMDAIEHVARISRVIRQPQGNALLLGVGGSGRQSLTKLATFMSGYKLYMIEISKGYGKNEWRDNLKEVLLLAGVDDKPVVFLFNDTQIVMEQMLEDVNSVLNSGDVPNLYGVDEMEKITAACKNDCAKRRVPPTKLNIFACYLMRVRRNIHMVLCMSPLGEAFRTRLRMFPSIVNCCTIDWFSEWPDEALKSVATRSVQQSNLSLGDHADKVIGFVKHIHQSVAEASRDYKEALRRCYYVTPTSYLELLSTYRNVLVSKRDEVGTLKNRLQVGLDKLISTAVQVESLQGQLTTMEPVLIATQADVEAMILQIGKDKADAAETQKVVAGEEAAALKKAAETKAIADDAQKDLDEALPALDAAVACLKDLKKADIDEVKVMGRPPAGVRLTMEATCVLFDVKPEKVADPDNPGKKINDYFKAAQKNLLSNANQLLENMQNFDKDNIPDRIVKAIDPFIAMPEFQPDAVEKASKACKAICMWVRAMYKYHDVAVMVEPKKALLATAQADLDQTLATLAVAQAKLKQVMDRIAELEANFKTANDKKEQLVKDVQECRARLDRAQKLIGGLGGERSRWTASCQAFELLYNNLIGDALLCAGMIAYSGAFTPDFRQRLLHNWHEQLAALSIPHTPECDLKSTLADPVAIRTWTICGLPQDNHSVENGIIMSKARRYPLFIDPQGQANRFIKNMGKDPALSENGIDVIKLSDKNFLRTLENGVRFGRWVLLENIGENLDAALEPLLLQQRFKQGGTEMIKVGDSTIPWNDSFRFFMTTKLPNPHYPPEICVKVSLLNFAITFSGLEDQLLGVVVVEEMPEMEQKKNSLVVANARMKKELKEIEDKILFMLSNSKGNILDDHELIETLASSKKTSQEITAKVAEAEKTEEEIDANREKYRPVAYRGSILYFLIADLAQVDPMYQYSLQWFTNLFIQAIRLAEKSPDLAIRLVNLNDYFTYYTYVNVCRSLFEKDKLLFSFIMTIKILQGDNAVDPTQWRFLISGKTPTSVEAVNPADDWIDNRMWTEIQALASMEVFTGFEKDVQTLVDEWRLYYDHADPHRLTLPGTWHDRLNSLQRMCVLRCFRADKVPEAILDFVMETMGQRFVEPPPFNLSSCFVDATVVTPLIFVLSKGSDPTKAFFEFAASMKFDRKVKGLSLGQGQGAKASRLIEDATQKGTWVYLQNCHLYISWLTELERLCENLSPDSVHKDFRLWLTSMPCKEFPVSILQNGVKMTNEPPKGLKANLRSAYFKLDNDKMHITSKPFEYKKLLFGLCCFHAIVQERRKFGPLGWNIPYEFNDTDLDISRGQLAIFLDSYVEVPYRVLNFLTSYINYGGRVTDYIDLRTIDVIMKSFYNEKILEDGYRFDKDGVYYSLPVDESDAHAGYMSYVDSLPLVAGPGIFGLHDNANIACALNETFSIFDTILSLQARESSKGGVSREDQIGATARDIEKRLNEKGAFDIEGIRMQYPVRYDESMNTVLLQECIRYNKLIAEMQRSLPELQKALKGLVVMSAELEAMGDAIAVNQVPKAWEAKAYPSMKPLGAWSSDLMERLSFINTWVEDGTPTVFWVSGFYFPQAFLTGSMQNYARKHRYAIDTIDFDFIMVETAWEEISKKPEDGVYIRGLYLEGARWDNATQSLADSRPKQLYTSLPTIHLSPVQHRKEPASGIYRCPVYKVLSRRGTLSTTGHSTNFIMWIEVPSSEPLYLNNANKADQEKWIKAGVAAFCSLRY